MSQYTRFPLATGVVPGVTSLSADYIYAGSPAGVVTPYAVNGDVSLSTAALAATVTVLSIGGILPAVPATVSTIAVRGVDGSLLASNIPISFDSGEIVLPLSSITFTDGTATVVSAYYRWRQVGSLVTFVAFVVLDNGNTGFDSMNFDMPTDMPEPMTWTNQSVDDCTFVGTAVVADYDAPNYGMSPQSERLFLCPVPSAPSDWGFWVYGDNSGNNRDRVFMSLTYTTAVGA